MAMTFYQELDDLRVRVAALEAKYETMRLATLEWGRSGAGYQPKPQIDPKGQRRTPNPPPSDP